MAKQKHFIQKVSIEVDFDSEEKSYDFQREFSAFVNERLLIVAEKVFDEFGRKKHIQINKLEIDLGDVLFDNYKEETIDRLDNLLRDKLSLLLSGFEFTSSQEKPVIFTSQDSDIE